MINLSLTDLNRIQFREKITGSYWSMWIKVAWCVITTYQMKQLSHKGIITGNVPE
ncbi:hypothetical protein OHD41_27425 [Escherichia coli]|nr:hypothetical protein [Escherichia coli]